MAQPTPGGCMENKGTDRPAVSSTAVFSWGVPIFTSRTDLAGTIRLLVGRSVELEEV